MNDDELVVFIEVALEDTESPVNRPMSQILVLEEYRPALLELRVKRYKALVMGREQMRMPNYPPDPKDKTTPRYTDFDRRTMLDAQVADLQAEYETAKGLEDLVKERIALCKLLLENK